MNEVSDADMADLLDEEHKQKLMKFSLNQAIDVADDTSWCPTPDCRYAFFWDLEEGEAGAEFNCPLCEKNYCMQCRVEFHKGMTCKEY